MGVKLLDPDTDDKVAAALLIRPEVLQINSEGGALLQKEEERCKPALPRL